MMKHKEYNRIFRGLRNQLLSVGLFALVLLALQVYFGTTWLIYCLLACVGYVVILFVIMIVIWFRDHA